MRTGLITAISTCQTTLVKTMDRIQTQASALWEIIFSEETAAIYQKAFNLTGTILKEAAQLVWLVICSFFVFGAWVGDTSVKAGKNIRTWVDQQGSAGSPPTSSTSMAEKGKSLLDTGRTGIAYLLNQARTQVGMEPTSAPTIAPAASTPPQPAPPQPAKPMASDSVTSDGAGSDGTKASDLQTDSNDIESAAASVPSVATSYGTGYSSTPRATEEDDSWPPQEKDESN